MKRGLSLLAALAVVILAGCAHGGFRAGSAPPMASPVDLDGRRIGVLLGSIYDTYATRTYPRATILHYKAPPDVVLAVKSGKVDAGFYTHECLQEVLRNDPELGQLGGVLYTVPIAIGISKANPALRDRFNQFLQELKRSGTLQDMQDRWITRGESAMPEIKLPEHHGVLTAGYVSNKGYPFTIIKDGKPIGFDIELVQRFAAWNGQGLELKDMEFGGLVVAAATGKTDLIVSTLVPTDERKKQIDFTDAYLDLGASVFALNRNLVHGSRGAAGPTLTWGTRLAHSFRSNVIEEKRYLLILDGLKTTLVISVLASLVGVVLGALVCWMRMSRNRLLNRSARGYISLLRGLPVLVVLMVIFYVIFATVDVNPVLVAVLAFGMNMAAYMAEIFRSGIEGVDPGQTEAGIAMGFTRSQTFRWIVLPQAGRSILPVAKGEFISLVKMTSIVGYIAVQDLTKAGDIIRSRTFDAFFPLLLIAALYLLLSWLLVLGLGFLERRLIGKEARV